MISTPRPAALLLPLALLAACNGSSDDLRDRAAAKGVVTPSAAPSPVASLSAALANLPASTVYLVTARKGVSYATLAGALEAVSKLPGVVGASIQQGKLQVTVRPGLEQSRRLTLLRQLAAVGVVSVPPAKK